VRRYQGKRNSLDSFEAVKEGGGGLARTATSAMLANKFSESEDGVAEELEELEEALDALDPDSSNLSNVMTSGELQTLCFLWSLLGRRF